MREIGPLRAPVAGGSRTCDHRSMLERIWLAAIVVFIAGWIIVYASPGNVVGGLAVYISTFVLITLAVVALVRWSINFTRRRRTPS